MVAVAEYHKHLVEDSIDISQKGNLTRFVQKKVDAAIENKETRLDPDMRAFLRAASSDMADLIVNNTLGRFPISGVNDRVPLANHLIPEIQRLLEFKETGVEVAGGFKAWVRRYLGGGNGKYSAIASNIAFDVMGAICRHPANKDL